MMIAINCYVIVASLSQHGAAGAVDREFVYIDFLPRLGGRPGAREFVARGLGIRLLRPVFNLEFVA